jgi:hypothetical protein
MMYSVLDVVTMVTEVQLQRKKKAAKGETRAAVDSAKASLKAAGKKRKASVELQTTRYVFTCLEASTLRRCINTDYRNCHDSDQKKTKASFPSGLVSNWQSKVSAPSQTSRKAKASGPHTGDTSTFGGLNDEDASATFSPISSNRKFKNDVRSFYRHLFPIWKGTDVTQFVAVIDSASEDDSDTIPAKTSRAKPVQKSTSLEVKSKSKPRSANLKVPKPEPESAILEAKSKPRSANLKAPKSEPKIASPSADISEAATSDINTLPEFARSAWSTSFLPTLYNLLGCSDNPFMIDANMLKVIQEVLDYAYPECIYVIGVDDRIFSQVSLSSVYHVSK